MSIPRGLNEEEAAAWAKLAATVTPMPGRTVPKVKAESSAVAPKQSLITPRAKPVVPPRPARVVATPSAPSPRDGGLDGGLDGRWDKRLKSGAIQPDFTLDLHGHSLNQAYDRLMSGLDQARAMEARVVLLIAGRSRPVDPADRGSRRGAIRAKILDWLAASRHESSIAAIRRAHIRHGGEGALYLVMKRQR